MPYEARVLAFFVGLFDAVVMGVATNIAEGGRSVGASRIRGRTT